MNMEILKPFLSGMARQAFTAVGAYLGFTGSTETQFVGAAMVLAGLGWEWWQQRGQQQVVAILAKMKPVVSPNASDAIAAKAGNEAAKEELKK
jgi:hypothetical protein